MLDCCIWDIENIKNANKIIIDLEISDKDVIIDNYNLELNLDKMGLQKDDDFADELYYDIRRFINDFYQDYNRIPNSKEIKTKIESINWLETKLWFER